MNICMQIIWTDNKVEYTLLDLAGVRYEIA